MPTTRRDQPKAPAGTSLGLAWLIPGLSQWTWGQETRGFHLASAYVSMLLVAVVAWGTSVGLLMLALAFLVHSFSMCDALRQAAFPGFGRTLPYLSTTVGLALSGYLPALLAGSTFACPSMDSQSRQGVLVNLVAFRDSEPKRGDAVVVAQGEPVRSRLARVLATANQEVECTPRGLLIDARLIGFDPFASSGGDRPSKMTFQVPDGQLLVSFTGASGAADGWGLVPRGSVRGRAWARLYPIWDRGVIKTG